MEQGGRQRHSPCRPAARRVRDCTVREQLRTPVGRMAVGDPCLGCGGRAAGMPSAGRPAWGGATSARPFACMIAADCKGIAGMDAPAATCRSPAAMPFLVDAIASTIAGPRRQREGGRGPAARTARRRARGGRAHACGAEAKAHRIRGQGRRGPVRRPRMAGGVQPHAPCHVPGRADASPQAHAVRRLCAASCGRAGRCGRRRQGAGRGRSGGGGRTAPPDTQVRPAGLSRWRARAPGAARPAASLSGWRP